MTDVLTFPSRAKPRAVSAPVGWLAGPDPADTLPTARAVGEAADRFSLLSAGVRAHGSQAAMMTDPELYDKHATEAIRFCREATAELSVIVALLTANPTTGEAA